MKLKTCSNCNKEVYLFKSKPPLCKSCYLREYSKPIKKVSTSYQKLLDEYKPIREKFLLQKPYCELNLQDCTKIATVIHHKQGKNTKELYLDVTKWMASCLNCNNKVEELGEIAYQKNLKLRKHEK